MTDEDHLEHLMKSPVKTIKTSGTAASAAKVMIKNKIGALVIVQGKKPVGIVTERDIVKLFVKGGAALKKPVRQFSSRLLITATPGTSVQEAFEVMLRNKIRRLPVIDGDNLVGIVTEKDLMRWTLRVSYEPNIPPHIKAALDAQ
jgi:CBS domain-containing protein